MKRHEYFKDFYDPDLNTVMHVFKIPEEFKSDYILLSAGHYSQISEELKQRIIRFHKAGQNDTIKQILYKDSELRAQMEIDLGETIPSKSELFDKPKKSTEWFRHE